MFMYVFLCLVCYASNGIFHLPVMLLKDFGGNARHETSKL